MQIVIEIPDDKIPIKQCYKDVLIKFVDKQVCEVTMIGQIPRKDETGLWFDVLPEGHGDLVDKSKLLVELECGIKSGNYEEGYEKYPHINDMDDCLDTIKYADTVIPADKDGD